MKQVMNCHKDNGLLNMIRRTDPMISSKRRKLNLVFVTPVCQTSENGNHLLIIPFILKDVLSIYTTQHHVVDSRSALLPYLSCHFISVMLFCTGKGNNIFQYLQILFSKNDQ